MATLPAVRHLPGVCHRYLRAVRPAAGERHGQPEVSAEGRGAGARGGEKMRSGYCEGHGWQQTRNGNCPLCADPMTALREEKPRKPPGEKPNVDPRIVDPVPNREVKKL